MWRRDKKDPTDAGGELWEVTGLLAKAAEADVPHAPLKEPCNICGKRVVPGNEIFKPTCHHWDHLLSLISWSAGRSTLGANVRDNLATPIFFHGQGPAAFENVLQGIVGEAPSTIRESVRIALVNHASRVHSKLAELETKKLSAQWEQFIKKSEGLPTGEAEALARRMQDYLGKKGVECDVDLLGDLARQSFLLDLMQRVDGAMESLVKIASDPSTSIVLKQGEKELDINSVDRVIGLGIETGLVERLLEAPYFGPHAMLLSWCALVKQPGFENTRLAAFEERWRFLHPLVKKKAETREVDSFEAFLAQDWRPPSLSALQGMTGADFERLILRIANEEGLEAVHLGNTGDQGADVILRSGTWSCIVQTKLYSQPVGNGAVQEAHAAKAFYNAQMAAVVTNADFTTSARKLAEKTKVRLVGGKQLEKILRDEEKLRTAVG